MARNGAERFSAYSDTDPPCCSTNGDADITRSLMDSKNGNQPVQRNIPINTLSDNTAISLSSIADFNRANFPPLNPVSNSFLLLEVSLIVSCFSSSIGNLRLYFPNYLQTNFRHRLLTISLPIAVFLHYA
jgi:hypothetical protein